MDTYTLTKLDVAAFRRADRVTVLRNVPNDEARVYCTKEPKREEKERNPYASDIVHIVPAPVRVRSSDCYAWGAESEHEATKHAVCYCSMSTYVEQITHTGSILKLLRVGDEIAFEFRADWHSNGYVARARLHADVLALIVSRDGKRVAEYELEHNICEDNTARMCKHVAPSAYWRKEAYGEAAS